MERFPETEIESAATQKTPTARLNPRFRNAVLGILGLAAGGCVDPAEEAKHRQMYDSPYAFLDAGPEKLKIDVNKPTFTTLRERKIFPEENKWAITANSEAFHATATRFAESPAGQELLQKKEVRFLNPGSGVLLTPLEIAFVFAEKSNDTNKFSYTFTEIDPDTFEKIDQYIESLVSNLENLSNFDVKKIENFIHNPGQPREIKSGQKIITFTYKTSSGREVQIQVNFEFKMSGSDKKYFRPESAQEADMYVWHDVAAARLLDKRFGEANILFSQVGPLPLKDKKRYLMITYDPKKSNKCSSNIDAYDGIGDKVIKPVLGFNYGCGENHQDEEKRENEGEKAAKGVAVIEIDTELMSALNKIGGEETLSNYAGYLFPAFESDLKEVKKVIALMHKVQGEKAKKRIKNALAYLIPEAIDAIIYRLDEIRDGQAEIKADLELCKKDKEACKKDIWDKYIGKYVFGVKDHDRFVSSILFILREYSADLKKAGKELEQLGRLAELYVHDVQPKINANATSKPKK